MARGASVTNSTLCAPLLQRMRSIVALLALGLFVVGGEPSRAHAQGPGFDELIVRTYDPGGLLAQRVVTARQTADQILRRAGVWLRWRHCDIAGTDSRAGDGSCVGPLAENEVVVRINDAPAAAAPGTLGFTYVDHSAAHSWLATVFADRLILTAHRVRLPLEVLVGRVIAHELGHLLLEQPGHAKRGFMQAIWTDEMLRRNRPSDWMFGPGDAGRVRRNAIARAERRDQQVLAQTSKSTRSNQAR